MLAKNKVTHKEHLRQPSLLDKPGKADKPGYTSSPSGPNQERNSTNRKYYNDEKSKKQYTNKETNKRWDKLGH